MEEELKKMFENHEKRIAQLEITIKPKEGKPSVAKKDYSGLVGGIRLITDEGFLIQPKSVKEIHTELKRLGYHYPTKSLSKILSVNFMKSWQILTRLEEDKVWKYVIKK